MLVRSIIFASVVAIAGCGPSVTKRACTGGTDQSPLVADAAMVRLDVYGDSAHCVDGLLAPGAGSPILSHSYGQGQTIKLDVPPGPHALVLATFSDSDGTQLLGVGCTEADLSAGAQLCFDLTIGPAPDGGYDPNGNPGGCSTSPDSCPPGEYCTVDGCVLGCKNDPDCVAMSAASDGGATGLDHCDPTTHQCVQCLVQTDCALGSVCLPSHVCAVGCDPAADALCPGTQTCCNKVCVDTNTDKLNCGGCGMACSTTNASAEQCTAGSCGWTCSSGFAHCAAGDTGCDTGIFNVSHCGGCNNVCDSTNSNGATCPAGVCTYTSCKPGRVDCNSTTGADTDGCETGALHSNGIGAQAQSWGLGQLYADCRPLGVPDNPATYTSIMANEAMGAAPGTPQTSAMCGNANCVWKVVQSLCTVWCYTNDTTKGGSNIAGHVYQNDAQHSPGGLCASGGNNASLCPLNSDPSWN